jgi:hypothetical protein
VTSCLVLFDTCDLYRLDVRPPVVLVIQLRSLLIKQIILQRVYMFRLKSKPSSVEIIYIYSYAEEILQSSCKLVSIANLMHNLFTL